MLVAQLVSPTATLWRCHNSHETAFGEMLMRFVLFPALICLATAVSATARADIQIIEQPQFGNVRPNTDHSAMMYVGHGAGTDSFTVSTEDENGHSLIDVWMERGVVHISNLDFGGPLALAADTLQLSVKGAVTTFPPAVAEQPAAVEEKPFVVIIYVDQPGTGGDRNTWEGGITGIDVGHTFIEVISGVDGSRTTVGFYPADGPGEPGNGVSPIDPQDPGILRPDNNHPWDVRHSIEITPEQHETIIRNINEDRVTPPTYDLNDCNCTDWVLDVLAEAGIVIPSREGRWPGGGGHNPGDLGEDLVARGGTRNPNRSR
jgi:hypothetical protein